MNEIPRSSMARKFMSSPYTFLHYGVTGDTENFIHADSADGC
jgi:hypothetical protein